MAGDLERLLGPVPPAAPGPGSAALTGELLDRVRAVLSVIGGLGEREQVLVSAWLTGLRSARTPEPVKLNETSGGWFYLTGFLGLNGGAGLVDPHLGGQGRGCRAPAAEPVRAGGEGVV